MIYPILQYEIPVFVNEMYRLSFLSCESVVCLSGYEATRQGTLSDVQLDRGSSKNHSASTYFMVDVRLSRSKYIKEIFTIMKLLV